VAHSSVLTSYLLGRHASSHVDGVLTGTGAENLMAGLVQQEVFMNVAKGRGIPAYLYRMFLAVMPLAWLQKQFDNGGRLGEPCRERLLTFLYAINRRAPIMHKYSHILPGFSMREKNRLYGDKISPFMEAFVDTQKDPVGWTTTIGLLTGLQKDHALQDCYLMPMDKSSVMTSLPMRMPFMDHPLVEFLIGLPDQQRYAGGKGKVLLRNRLRAIMPDAPEITHKAAAMPLHKFMTTRLMREMVETCLSEQSTKKRGLFKPEEVRNVIQQSREGDVLCLHQVMTLMMLEIWFRIYVDREKGWISR
jgi:asparagine synthase (glutamine-hydrolysing)